MDLLIGVTAGLFVLQQQRYEPESHRQKQLEPLWSVTLEEKNIRSSFSSVVVSETMSFGECEWEDTTAIKGSAWVLVAPSTTAIKGGRVGPSPSQRPLFLFSLPTYYLLPQSSLGRLLRLFIMYVCIFSSSIAPREMQLLPNFFLSLSLLASSPFLTFPSYSWLHPDFILIPSYLLFPLMSPSLILFFHSLLFP